MSMLQYIEQLEDDDDGLFDSNTATSSTARHTGCGSKCATALGPMY